ncbi:hypothetical protein HYH03_003709 [Edaphochlamys debaryana]|uniref:Uncharacterized protein n=1 Tax=Edaphochlamys debaryana TaxID=47281 RepID=A0A835YGV6_9CHLO|nr:hypothetical protein HYH03_003709 [Edaphochlamys debaryana]|eukprot:KAG2498455.1 hypothetical protein HYH03_003709 [Edaphochlamys debaryana]
MPNFYALRHVLEDWDWTMPYIVTDAFFQGPVTPQQDPNDKRDTFAGGYSPRCLPCHFRSHPVLGRVLDIPGRGEFAAPAGCPCTTELACSRRPSPGGYGFAISRGLFECWPFSNTTALLDELRAYIARPDYKASGGDMLLANFVGHVGLWFTDPGPYWWLRGEAEDVNYSSSFGARQAAQVKDPINSLSRAMLEGRCIHDVAQAGAQHVAHPPTPTAHVAEPGPGSGAVPAVRTSGNGAGMASPAAAAAPSSRAPAAAAGRADGGPEVLAGMSCGAAGPNKPCSSPKRNWDFDQHQAAVEAALPVSPTRSNASRAAVARVAGGGGLGLGLGLGGAEVTEEGLLDLMDACEARGACT